LRDRKSHNKQIELVEAALQVLRQTHNPTLKRDARGAKRHVKAAIAQVAKQRAAYEGNRRARKKISAQQRRLVARLRHMRASASYSMVDILIDHLIVQAQSPVWIKRKRGITIWDGPHPKDMAARLMFKLLYVLGAPRQRKGREKLAQILPPVTRNGASCKLAAILYGDPEADLFQYVRKVASKLRHEIRYFTQAKKPG
jgi:hypothetical protein